MSAIQSNRPEKDAKNRVPLTRKFQRKSCPTIHWYFLQKKFTILERFAKSFPTKRKPSKCPTKEKKRGQRKAKEAGRREILLSTHARTLKAVIWHLEQKLVQCSTCKQRFEQLGFFLARQRPENGLTRFKRHFLAKCPGVNGLIELPPYVLCRSKEHQKKCGRTGPESQCFSMF